MDGSPIHIIKIKVVQVGERHLRVSFLLYIKKTLQKDHQYPILHHSEHTFQVKPLYQCFLTLYFVQIALE